MLSQWMIHFYATWDVYTSPQGVLANTCNSKLTFFQNFGQLKKKDIPAHKIFIIELDKQSGIFLFEILIYCIYGPNETATSRILIRLLLTIVPCTVFPCTRDQNYLFTIINY